MCLLHQLAFYLLPEMQLVAAARIPRPVECPSISSTNFGHEFEFMQSAPLQPLNLKRSEQWRICCSYQEDIEQVKSVTTNPRKNYPRGKRKHAETAFRKLTRRIMELSKRKQLDQVFKEVKEAEEQLGKVNKIVMNAVLSGCVHCKDVDRALLAFQDMSKPGGCGVDNITFGILIKGLCEAQRLDEAYELLEAIERGIAPGHPKLLEWLVQTLLNAFVETGDVQRARGVFMHYHSLWSQMHPSIFIYNLFIKGYARSENPLEALKLWQEMSNQGLKPDRFTYNTLIMASVRAREMGIAMELLKEMKEEGQKLNSPELLPNVITYTTLLKGFGNDGNLHGVSNIVAEMKAASTCFMDRVAYTAISDAFLAAGSTSEALKVFDELLEKSKDNTSLRPKAHAYLSLMRALADKGNVDMVKNLHSRMVPECAGNPSVAIRAEADELLIEAAVNDGQVALAKQVLDKLIGLKKNKSLSDRAFLAVVRLQTISGFTDNHLSPYILERVSFEDPVEKIMLPYLEANPLPASLQLCKVVMRFFRENAVPVTDQWGHCIGVVYREDCNELNAQLSSMMRSPPPFVTSCTSIGRAIAFLLDQKYKMIVVVKSESNYDGAFGYSMGRTVGFLTSQHLFSLVCPASHINR